MTFIHERFKTFEREKKKKKIATLYLVAAKKKLTNARVTDQ